jgi:hypothetical protein
LHFRNLTRVSLHKRGAGMCLSSSQCDLADIGKDPEIHFPIPWDSSLLLATYLGSQWPARLSREELNLLENCHIMSTVLAGWMISESQELSEVSSPFGCFLSIQWNFHSRSNYTFCKATSEAGLVHVGYHFSSLYLLRVVLVQWDRTLTLVIYSVSIYYLKVQQKSRIHDEPVPQASGKLARSDGVSSAQTPFASDLRDPRRGFYTQGKHDMLG